MEATLENTSAIILAAGNGTRMQSSVQKQFMTVGERMVIEYSLSEFSRLLDEIIVAIPSNEVLGKIKNYPNVKYIQGGSTRTKTIREAIRHVNNPFVLIHDAARPLVDQQIIERVIINLSDYESVCPVMPVVNSIVIDSDGELLETPIREAFREVQTPQGFRTPLLKRAIETIGEEHAHIPELIRRAGGRCKHIEGSPWLLKITYPPSLHAVEYYINNKKESQ